MTNTKKAVELIIATPEPFALTVFAARTCKNSIDKSDTLVVKLLDDPDLMTYKVEVPQVKDRALVKWCLDAGHDSILEHASFTFRVNFSRVCQAQMFRHRLASYSAESARAVDLSKKGVEEAFYIPHFIKHGEKIISYSEPHGDAETSSDVFWCSVAHSLDSYRILIEGGVPVEDARYVLPMALMQPVIMTMNLRQWRHVIKERTCKHAQYEIRCVAKAIRRILSSCDDIFVYKAEKIHQGCQEQCGECLTNWEGMEKECRATPKSDD